MRTTTRRAANRGQMAQKRFESVKGFAQSVSNEIAVNGIDSKYFADVYIGYLADALRLQKADNEKAADVDKRADKMAADKFAAMMADDEQRAKMAESLIYKTMQSADEIYKIFRASLPCYTDGVGRFNFAKVKRIAICAANLTTEQKAEIESKDNWHKVTISVDGTETAYFCGIEYDAAEIESYFSAKRKQRRAFLKDEKEQARAWLNNNDDIITMVAIDKANYKDLARTLSAAMQQDNAAIIRRNADAAEKANKAAKAKEKADIFVATIGDKKIADLAAIAEKVQKAVTDNKYNNKARKSAESKANNLASSITTAAEIAAEIYAAEKAALSMAAEKLENEYKAAADADDAKTKAEISLSLDANKAAALKANNNANKAAAIKDKAAALLAEILAANGDKADDNKADAVAA